MKNKTKVGLNMATDLVEKLDQIAKETYRNRSQTIEALVAHAGIEGLKLAEAQAKKIKELESELILFRSDTGDLPKIDKDLLADQIAENERLTGRLKEAKKKEELCLRLQTKLINLGDSINGLYKESQREVL